jgi:23S rRNA (cytosine1962-C5)-methyltransferase
MAYPTDAQRLFHGRGGRYPGCEQLSLDAFPPALVLTSLRRWPTRPWPPGAALAQRWQQIAPADQPLTWVFQTREAGGKVETRTMAGALPEPHVVTENGASTCCTSGAARTTACSWTWQPAATGCASRCWPTPARTHEGAQPVRLHLRVLGGGQAGRRRPGAEHGHEQGALATGQHNHQLNGVKAGASFAAHDIFSSWGKINRSGPYDLIIVDPPSYQKGSFIATKDYARLMRRLPDLLAPDGQVLLCLNAPELGTAFLREQMSEIAPSCTSRSAFSNPPVFADVDEERSLKVLVYRAPGLPGASSEATVAPAAGSVLSVPQALRPESCRQPPAPPRTPPHSKCHDRFRLSRPSDLSALDPALACTLQRFARLDADTPTPQLDYAGRRRLLSTLQAQLLRSPLPGMVRTDHFVPAQGREITVRSYQKAAPPARRPWSGCTAAAGWWAI